MNLLKGYRTYILGALALVTIGANFLGYLDTETANTLLAVLGFSGLISLRAAVK